MRGYLFSKFLFGLLVWQLVGAAALAQESEWTKQKLFAAARNGDLDSVRAALDAGVDVNSKTDYNSTALFFACDRGNMELVKLLLERGADPNVEDSFYNATPVTWAQQNNHFDIVLVLLANGGKGGDSMLMAAVSAADAEQAKKILDTKSISPLAIARAYNVAKRKNSDALLAAFAGVDVTATKEDFKLDPATLKQYEGKFQEGSMTVSFQADDNSLKMKIGEGTLSQLAPIGLHEFMLGGSTIQFEMDGERVKQVLLTAGPRKFTLAPVTESANEPVEKESSEITGTVEIEWAESSEASRAADLAVSSKNWPSFRGNGARGVADGQHPPLKWDVKSGDNVLWKTPIAGLGLSCPVIWDDKIFITSAVSNSADAGLKIGLYGDVSSVEDDSEFDFQVICLDKTSGELLWEKTANHRKPAVKRHTKSSHANPTIATDGKHVVAFFGSEGLYCFDTEGNLIWEKDLGFLDSGWFYDPGYQWGFGSSPVIFDGHVIVQCDIQSGSFVASFDVDTGDETWRVDRDEIPSWSTPTVHRFGDLPMLITAATRSARGYDARNGELLWSLQGFSEIVVPTPFVAHDLIFLASGYSPIQPIYAVRPDSRGDISLDGDNLTNASIPWSVKRGGPYLPTPIVYGDYLYCCANNGVLSCYKAVTGAEVYKERLKAGAGGTLSFTASPLAADGYLYLTAEDGRVLIVKAGPKFELAETNEVGENVLATPAISSGVVFFRTQNHVIAVGR
jgi:outer membrane protein assembly factor BamB